MFDEEYDIPDELIRGHSPEFDRFLHHWFEDSTRLIRGERDLGFLDELTPKEREAAGQLLRRNLKLKYTHIIEGFAAIRDVSAVPLLRQMLALEKDLSRRLTIAGVLWKLCKDNAFVECLKELKACRNAILKQAHFHQILWLGDEQAIDFLIELLDDPDVHSWALMELNDLEFGERFFVPPDELPCQSNAYRKRRYDPKFLALMVDQLRERNELGR